MPRNAARRNRGDGRASTSSRWRFAARAVYGAGMPPRRLLALGSCSVAALALVSAAGACSRLTNRAAPGRPRAAAPRGRFATRGTIPPELADLLTTKKAFDSPRSTWACPATRTGAPTRCGSCT